MYSHTFTLIRGKLTQAVNHNTTHTEHKAFQRPFVSLLNLTIVPPRQSTDKVWMDLLRPPEVEAMPCIFTVNVVLMSKVQCVCPWLRVNSWHFSLKQHITWCSTEWQQHMFKQFSPLKGRFRTLRRLSYCNTNDALTVNIQNVFVFFQMKVMKEIEQKMWAIWWFDVTSHLVTSRLFQVKNVNLILRQSCAVVVSRSLKKAKLRFPPHSFRHGHHLVSTI